MGRGESVVLEADVGFKDKEGAFKDTESVLSPHGNGSDSAAANAASHVEDGAQGRASTKISELENMKRLIDEQRTPAGKGTEGSRFNSAKDELKAQLSSIKAALAANTSDADRVSDAGDVSAKVRNQLSHLHDAVDQSDDDDDERDAAHLKSPVAGSESAQIAAPWSSKREQLKAKLQSYQAQLRIAKNQGIARRLDTDDADEATRSRAEEVEEEEDLMIHSGAGKAELDVAGKKSSSHDMRAQNLQHDIQKSLENIKKIEAAKATDASSAAGSSAAMSNAPLEAHKDTRRGAASKDHSSPYAGVFPRSDDDLGSEGAGTKRSSAKTGAKPTPLKPIATNDAHDGGDADSIHAGSLDEEDPVMLAEERVRQAYGYAGGFAVGMCLMSVLSFVFGIFMPWGFSAWAISLPLGAVSVYFLRYCYPLAISSDNMPQSLAWVSVAVIYVSCFLFFSGILSASASLSIAPILGSPLCSGLIPPPISMTPVSAPRPVPAPRNNSVTLTDEKGNICVFLTDQDGKPINSTMPSNSAGKANLTNTTDAVQDVADVKVNALSGLDADTLMKFGACKGWNMCAGNGIKMLTCSKLKSFNDWNAVFFILSSFLVGPLWLWIYYLITVRLHENAVAGTVGTSEANDVLDCSIPACVVRMRESLSLAFGGDEMDGAWSEEASQPDAIPKFQADGPFRDRHDDRV